MSVGFLFFCIYIFFFTKILDLKRPYIYLIYVRQYFTECYMTNRMLRYEERNSRKRLTENCGARQPRTFMTSFWAADPSLLLLGGEPLLIF